MQIIISTQSKEAIYEQIFKQIRQQILTGELQPGEALPSMRQLAKDLHISVITTKRAYEELEKQGYIYSIVGKGSFVSEQNVDIIHERKLNALEEKMNEVVVNGKELGLTLKELQDLLEIYYKE